MRSIRTSRARERFLAVLSETCNVSEAARAAGISRRSAYDWKDDDAEFKADWDDAVDVAVDALEKVAWDRATIDKSDRMLEILLKAHRGEKYREKHLIGSDPDNPLPAGFTVNLVKGDAER